MPNIAYTKSLFYPNQTLILLEIALKSSFYD